MENLKIDQIGVVTKDIDKMVRFFREKFVEQGEIAGVRYAYLDTEKDIGLTLEFIEA